MKTVYQYLYLPYMYMHIHIILLENSMIPFIGQIELFSLLQEIIIDMK